MVAGYIEKKKKKQNRKKIQCPDCETKAVARESIIDLDRHLKHFKIEI